MQHLIVALALGLATPPPLSAWREPAPSEEGEDAASWDETEAAEAEPDAPAAEEPTAAPVAAPAPSSATPAEPKFKGIGLLATAATLSAGALGVTIARNVIFKKNCPLKSGSTTTKCTYDFGSDIGLTLTHWILNLGAVGFAPAAGAVMGKYHAWLAATGKGPERNKTTFVGAGAGVLAGGFAVLGTSMALSFVLTKRCVDKEAASSDPLSGDRCLLKAYPTWTMLNWAGFAMIGAGAGMLAFGTKYGKWHRIYTEHQVRFLPYAGPRTAGLGVAGAF